MGGEYQRQDLSDGSYYTITDIITDTSSSAADSPLLKMNLTIHQTFQSIVISRDQAGNPRAYLESEESHLRVPTTLHLPGNTNRDAFSSSFHKWLHSVNLQYPMDDDFLWEFTFQMTDSVFDDNNLHHKVLVSADLHCVPTLIGKDDDDDDDEDYEPMEDVIIDEDEPMEDEQQEEEEYDPVEYVDEEEYEPMEDEEEYDPVEFVEEDNGDESLIKLRVKALSDIRAVVATEEHRKIGDCLICLEPLFSVIDEEEDEDEKKKKNCLFGSPCGHYFHGECMSEWLTRSVSCPLCRFDVSSLIEQ